MPVGISLFGPKYVADVLRRQTCMNRLRADKVAITLHHLKAHRDYILP
jgi:hypothetical protein